MAELVSFDVEESELDCGHFTMFWHGKGWSIAFDFRSSRAKSVQMLERAGQFLDASKFSADKGHASASVDNLFSSCELISKAMLILHRSPAVTAKTHGRVGSAINKWGKFGNVDAAFLKIYNRMSQERTSARYDASTEVTTPTAHDFDIVGRELETLKNAVAQQKMDRARAS